MRVVDRPTQLICICIFFIEVNRQIQKDISRAKPIPDSFLHLAIANSIGIGIVKTCSGRTMSPFLLIFYMAG